MNAILVPGWHQSHQAAPVYLLHNKIRKKVVVSVQIFHFEQLHINALREVVWIQFSVSSSSSCSPPPPPKSASCLFNKCKLLILGCRRQNLLSQSSSAKEALWNQVKLLCLCQSVSAAPTILPFFHAVTEETEIDAVKICREMQILPLLSNRTNNNCSPRISWHDFSGFVKQRRENQCDKDQQNWRRCNKIRSNVDRGSAVENNECIEIKVTLDPFFIEINASSILLWETLILVAGKEVSPVSNGAIGNRPVGDLRLLWSSYNYFNDH